MSMAERLFSDAFKQDMAFILEKAAAANRALSACALTGELSDQLGLLSSEIAVVSLVAADELDGMRGTETVLMRGEIALRLRQIATHCLDAQETEEEDELRRHFRGMVEVCEKLSALVGVSMPEPPGEEGLVPLDIRSLEETILSLGQRGGEAAEKLWAEIRALRELLTSLVMEREHLETVVLPEIEAAYMRELGSLEAEIYRAECELRILKKRLEMMRAAVNRDQPVREAEIDESLRKSIEEFRQAYEDFVRRVNEARSHTPPQQAGEGGKEAEDLEQERKRLYRKLVKSLHPDLHPGQDEVLRAMFKKAVTAYKAKDLKTLRELDGMLSGEEPDGAALILEELRREKARLLELIHGVRREMRAMKERYPYTKKSLLEDPVLLRAERERLGDTLVRTTEAVKIYRERIERMRENHG